jgi:hypothetical protein
MDPIRPIGPRERDLEPVTWVPRPSPDAQRERQEPQDPPPRRRPPAEDPPVTPPQDDGEGPSLIDIKV